MMLCQDCDKNLASVRYAEVVDGKVSDVHLCKDCLNWRQTQDNTGFEFTSPSPFLKKDGLKLSEFSAETNQTCTACSISLGVIMETGTVGCSMCYETFPAQIEALLEGIHSGLQHRGKTPRLDDARARARTELQSKRALLKSALGAENYEEAALLRDEIHALELGLGASEAGVE